MPPATNHKRLESAGQATIQEALQERIYCEVKKRSHKMAAASRNEDSCLLLF